jgi:hypothetical protein
MELDLSRRRLLAAAGLGAGAAAVGERLPAEAAQAAGAPADPATTPPVAGLHLQFGADAASEMVVSWHTLQPVRRPRVLVGRIDGTLAAAAGGDVPRSEKLVRSVPSPPARAIVDPRAVGECRRSRLLCR